MASPSGEKIPELRSVQGTQQHEDLQPPARTNYETVAQNIGRRARRRLFVAMLPLVFMMALLVYLLVRSAL